MANLMVLFNYTPDSPWLLWQRNLGQNWLSFGLCKKYLWDFCVCRGFSGMGHWMLPIEFFPNRPPLPRQRKSGQNCPI